MKNPTRRFINRGHTSVRFTKDHLSLLDLAAEVAGIPKIDLIQACYDRSAVKCGDDIGDDALVHAATKVNQIQAKLRVVRQDSGRVYGTPFALRLYEDSNESLRIAAEEANMSHGEVLEVSVEDEIVSVVRDILVKRYIAKDKSNAKKIGRWAAHMRNKPKKPSNGHVRLLRSIAAQSSRGVVKRK